MTDASREEGEIRSDDEPEVAPTQPEIQSARSTVQIPCRYCRRKFAKPGNLNKHIRKIHMDLWGGHPLTPEERRREERERIEQLCIEAQGDREAGFFRMTSMAPPSSTVTRAVEPESSEVTESQNSSPTATGSQDIREGGSEVVVAEAANKVKRKPNKRMLKCRKMVHPAHCSAVIQRDLVCARNQLDFDLSPQPLPTLTHPSDIEKQWADQKGGCFRQPLPINTLELAKRVLDQPKRSVAEMAEELMTKCRLSPAKLKKPRTISGVFAQGCGSLAKVTAILMES